MDPVDPKKKEQEPQPARLAWLGSLNRPITLAPHYHSSQPTIDLRYVQYVANRASAASPPPNRAPSKPTQLTPKPLVLIPDGLPAPKRILIERSDATQKSSVPTETSSLSTTCDAQPKASTESTKTFKILSLAAPSSSSSTNTTTPAPTLDIASANASSPSVPSSAPISSLAIVAIPATTPITSSVKAKADTTEEVPIESSSLDSNAKPNKRLKKSVSFNMVEVYHFNRSQGFSSIPSEGGSTLGMKRNHFLKREILVDLYEEVRRKSRREILLKIRLEKERAKAEARKELQCNSASSASSSSSSSNDTNGNSDSDDESYSEFSDISDSELETESLVFCQPIEVKLRRSLLRESGVKRIDPMEKIDCDVIRDSRANSGCGCVNQCVPGVCQCTLLGVNCHVDRISYPCGCSPEGCQNPNGRTEFDVQRVKGHLFSRLIGKTGVG